MDKVYPEVSWIDGLLLRPHHLQALQRHCQGLVSALVQSRPFSYGIRTLEISDARVRAFEFVVESCDLVMPDGTPVILGQNAFIPCENFSQLKTDERSVLEVFLALPQPDDLAPNVIDSESYYRGEGVGRRCVAFEKERRDENLGTNPQNIVFKYLKPELIIGTRPTGRYTSMKIAELRKVVESPEDEGSPVSYYELLNDFVPACLAIRASPILKNILTDLEVELDKVNKKLRRRLKVDMESNTAGASDLLKLQATNGVLPVLRQLQQQPDMHPFDVYLQLQRLAGDLAIFTDFATPRLPTYDHDAPFNAFDGLRREWLRRLPKFQRDRESYVFFTDGARPGVFEVGLEADHLEPDNDVFIAFRSDLPLAQVEEKFNVAIVKLGAPEKVADPGRMFTHIRCSADPGMPPHLKVRSGWQFLRIEREGAHWDEARAVMRLGLTGDLTSLMEREAMPRLWISYPGMRGGTVMDTLAMGTAGKRNLSRPAGVSPNEWLLFVSRPSELRGGRYSIGVRPSARLSLTRPGPWIVANGIPSFSAFESYLRPLVYFTDEVLNPDGTGKSMRRESGSRTGPVDRIPGTGDRSRRKRLLRSPA